LKQQGIQYVVVDSSFNTARHTAWRAELEAQADKIQEFSPRPSQSKGLIIKIYKIRSPQP
jgi:hypothetical protein